jgi:hypothetical protein
MQVMAAVLRLNLTWLPDEPDHLGDLAVSRGHDDVLTYDDGISLRVVVLDPALYASAEELVASAQVADEPGRVACGSPSCRGELHRCRRGCLDCLAAAEGVQRTVRGP